jgi:hypothetical protein
LKTVTPAKAGAHAPLLLTRRKHCSARSLSTKMAMN